MTFPYPLSPDAADVIERYLAEVRAALASEDVDIAEETVAAVEAHIAEQLGPDAGRRDAEAVVASLGPAAAYASVPTSVDGDHIDADTSSAGRPRGAGRVLGVPYDVRMPTAERVASRWWNPADPRIFMPRAFGVGWDLNMGALAVKLNLIEPDAEESPFASVPQRAFVAALLVPVALTVAMLASYLLLLPELPAQLPSHWGPSGLPDGYSSRGWAVGLLSVLAALPTLYAAVSVAARRPPLNRGVAIAFASLFAALSGAIWLLTLVSVFTSFVSAWLPPMLILGAVAVPAVVLVLLARTGRAAEIRSDLGR